MCIMHSRGVMIAAMRREPSERMILIDIHICDESS
jgi:hypothetical protein